MRLYTPDEKKMVDIGTGSIWYSIYSTAEVAFSKDIKMSIPFALKFLKTGECRAEDIKATKRQLILVQEGFSDIAPGNAVYDLRRPDVAPPWTDNIASTVTSCANLYTTADGKDLLTAVLELLEYAANENLPIFAS